MNTDQLASVPAAARPAKAACMVRPPHRTRITISHKDGKKRKALEVCDELLTCEEYRRWMEGTELVDGILRREVVAAAHPESSAASSASSMSALSSGYDL